MPTNAVTLDDFINGIMAGLILGGQSTFNMKNMAVQLVEAFDILNKQPAAHCQLRFHLESSPLGGISRSSQVALDRAIHRKILNQTEEQVTIKLSPQEAEKILHKLPFTSEFWQQLAFKCR